MTLMQKENLGTFLLRLLHQYIETGSKNACSPLYNEKFLFKNRIPQVILKAKKQMYLYVKFFFNLLM